MATARGSGTVFQVWTPKGSAYDVIMGAEWCYDNDALSVGPSAKGGGRQLRGPDMNPHRLGKE